MKKMIKKQIINNVFSFPVCALALGFVAGIIFSAAIRPVHADTSSYQLDSKISALIDPFLSKLPPPPPPKKEDLDFITIPAEPIKPPPPPPPPPKPVMPTLVLSGTLLSKDNSRAIVNGKVLAVGDEIEGVKIIDILRGEVDVFFEGEYFVIKLGSNSSSNSSSNLDPELNSNLDQKGE